MLTDNSRVSHDSETVDDRSGESHHQFPEAPKLAPEKFDFVLSLPILPRPYSSPIAVHFGVKKYRRWRNIIRSECLHCFYCGRLVSLKTSALDHVVPRYRGGGNSPHNLRLACHWCNGLKGNLSLYEFAGKIKRMAERIHDLADALSREDESTARGDSAILITAPDEDVEYHPRTSNATPILKEEGELGQSTGNQPSLKSRLMAESPHCAGCGIRLQAENHRLVDNYARLLRSPRKLACRKCQGTIAAQFHAERIAAAVQSKCSEAVGVAVASDL